MHVNCYHTHGIPLNRRICFKLHYLIPTFVEAGGYLEKLHDMLQDSVTMMMMFMFMMMMMMMRLVMDSDNRYRC